MERVYDSLAFAVTMAAVVAFVLLGRLAHSRWTSARRERAARTLADQTQKEEIVSAALRGTIFVAGDHLLSAISGGDEILNSIRRMVGSSLVTKREAADVVVNVGVIPQVVATYQDGSTFSTVTTRLQFTARQRGQLLSVEFPGIPSPPAPKILRMLGEPPTRFFGDVPKDEVIACAERLLKKAGVYQAA